MTTMVAISLAIYSAWCALNIQQSYFFNKKMTAGNIWNVINGYWGYAITDMTICFICFVISILGVNHG